MTLNSYQQIPWKQTLGRSPIMRIPLLNLPVVSWKKHHIHQPKFEKSDLPLISKKTTSWPSHWMFFPPLESLKGPFSASTTCVFCPGTSLATNVQSWIVNNPCLSNWYDASYQKPTKVGGSIGCTVALVGVLVLGDGGIGGCWWGRKGRGTGKKTWLCRKSLCRKWGIFWNKN